MLLSSIFNRFLVVLLDFGPFVFMYLLRVLSSSLFATFWMWPRSARGHRAQSPRLSPSRRKNSTSVSFYSENSPQGVFIRNTFDKWGALSGLWVTMRFTTGFYSHFPAFTSYFLVFLTSWAKERIVVINRHMILWMISLVSWILVWKYGANIRKFASPYSMWLILPSSGRALTWQWKALEYKGAGLWLCFTNVSAPYFIRIDGLSTIEI